MKPSTIISPLITEKGTRLKEQCNQYAFAVARDANKIEIRKAIETRFKVTVTKVRIMRVPGKQRRVRLHYGLTPERKKAIVTVKAGQSIAGYESV